jgi:serine/threonine protein phosphatase PrpC
MTQCISARLHGSQCESIGEIAAISEGHAAIALSLGGAPKRYAHTDRNEDATAFAIGQAGSLLVIADGHSGRDAAELATGAFVTRFAELFTASAFSDARERWADVAFDAIFEVHTEILASVARGARDTARTTLAVALLRPADDLIAFASMGDSHIFRVGSLDVVDLAYHVDRRSWFLGAPEDDRGTLSGKCVIGTENFDDTQAVVLATDGLSERGIGVDVPESTVGECIRAAGLASPELRALRAARGVAEAANDAQRRHRAGDNIAAAVAWIDRDVPANRPVANSDSAARGGLDE